VHGNSHTTGRLLPAYKENMYILYITQTKPNIIITQQKKSANELPALKLQLLDRTPATLWLYE
jgi:hypothetical protein